MKVSIVVITYNRRQEIEECVNLLLKNSDSFYELLLINNNSEDRTSDYLNSIQDIEKVKIFNLNENLGISGGRNFGAKEASGDIFVFIDDDAEFFTDNPIPETLKKFNDELDVGILAYQIVNPHQNKILRKEFPCTDKNKDKHSEFLTSTFIGAGHAIRKEVFEKTGGYDEELFGYMDELELSFKAIDCGFKIKYFPTVGVLHKVSPRGRLNPKEFWIRMFRNRLIINYKYLPLFFRLISFLIWSLKITYHSKNLTVALLGIKDFKKVKGRIPQRKIGKNAIQYMKKYYGRLYY